MAEIKDRILAELENIDKVIIELSNCGKLSEMSTIEISGVGALLHNFYNGIENVVKQVFIDQGLALPSGTFWHKDLIEIAEKENILSSSTKKGLAPFLAFRHFFVHGYSLNLRPELMVPLIDEMQIIYKEFKKDLQRKKLI